MAELGVLAAQCGGEQGALKVFGTGSKAKFNWERI
jgi:hypothetical protein